MDTLFVDEGFGTLDALALDAVMNVLDELRRGGRTVGVISHLEELRTRIPTRLEVVAGRHGSRLAALSARLAARGLTRRRWRRGTPPARTLGTAAGCPCPGSPG